MLLFHQMLWHGSLVVKEESGNFIVIFIFIFIFSASVTKFIPKIHLTAEYEWGNSSFKNWYRKLRQTDGITSSVPQKTPPSHSYYLSSSNMGGRKYVCCRWSWPPRMVDGQFVQAEWYGGQIQTWKTYDSLSFCRQFLFTRMYKRQWKQFLLFHSTVVGIPTRQ
jgi:hypothetical protein